jgi:hypothetical protein
MQYSQTHLVSRTDKSSFLLVEYDDRESPEYLFECPFATTIEQPKRDPTVGHLVDLGLCYAQCPTQLKAVVDPSVEQDYESIGQLKRLSLEQIFRC